MQKISAHTKNTETVFNYTYRKLNGNLLLGFGNLVKLYSGKNLTLDMTMTSVFFNLQFTDLEYIINVILYVLWYLKEQKCIESNLFLHLYSIL